MSSLILHLSDLHLSKDHSPELGDYGKSDVLSPEHRATLQKALPGTLRRLAELLNQQKLDAVVVSGDIDFGKDHEGFEQFEGLLKNLNGCLPSRDRIVVVPGNHDVIRHTPPGSEERYARFK